MPAPSLPDLFREDGVKLQRQGKGFKAKCLWHQEKTASLSIFRTEKGSWRYHCFGCKVDGDAVDYLVERRNMSKREALRAVKGDGSPRTGDPSPQRVPPRSANDTDADEAREVAFIPKLPKRHKGRWIYRYENGRVAFVVQRYTFENGKKGFGQYTPVVRDGKRIWAKALRRDRPRPLYRLKELLEDPGQRQVCLTEGEKCADALLKAVPKALVSTWAGGTDGWGKTDFTPLHGRRICLIADGDTPGHDCMLHVAQALSKHCADIVVVLPPIDDEKKLDVADEIEAGGNVRAWLKRYSKKYTEKMAPKDDGDEKSDSKKEEKKPPPVATITDSLGDNEYFTILGNSDEMVVIKLRTNQVVMRARGRLIDKKGLYEIAPDPNWWNNLLQVDAVTRGIADQAGTALIRIADTLGQVDVNRVMNRGCVRNEKDELVWHLGDRLYVNGATRDLNYDDENIYVSGPAIRTGDLAGPALNRQDKRELAELLIGFRWKEDADAQRMLGWMVAALAGGAMDWRPHLWFLGGTDSGKSYFAKAVLQPIFDNAFIWLSSPSEAMIARAMRSSSLPIWIDEAEPEQKWLEAVVTLCRVAAGGDGSRGRADGAGMGYTIVTPRFSAVMSSTKLPTLGAADNNRFSLVRTSAEEPLGWPDFQTRLDKTFRYPSKTAERIRTSIIQDSAKVAKYARYLVDSGKIDARGRRAMITASLSAGWWWWTGKEDIVEHVNPRATGKASDASEVLMDILGHRIRTRDGSDRTLLDLCGYQNIDAEEQLASYGIRYDASEGLLISTRSPSIRKTLARSRYDAADLGTLLTQIDGVIRCDNPRKVGSMRVRCLLVPNETCQRLGLAFARSR